jgi:hypothetical protein
MPRETFNEDLDRIVGIKGWDLYQTTRDKEVNKKKVKLMNTDFLTGLRHLQYRLLNKGELIIRTDESSESQWFVNCFIYRDYEKYIRKETGGNSPENKFRIYRNWVTDLEEAINNCINILNYYEEHPTLISE